MNIFRKHEISKPDKTRLLLGLLLIVSPWIVLFFTTIVITHHSVFESGPCWSDELSYWHETLSFCQKGFDFGYYTINEALPKCLSFGTHGFGAVSVYALFGKIFGWKTYSIVIANSFFLSLAFLISVIISKVSSKNLLSMLLFSMSFTPLILFSSTSMTELLNFSVLIVYIGLLYVYFKRGGNQLLALLLVFCTGISFIRIIYIVLFLPLLLNRKDGFRIDFRFWIYFVLWLIYSMLLFFVNNLFVSPYPDSFLSGLFASSSLSDLISSFSIHFVQNLRNFINPLSDSPIQVLLRYFILITCVYSLIKSKILQSRFKSFEIEYFIVFLILFLFLLINITAYDIFDWRDYRVMAPVLFGCILFLILSGKRSVLYFSLGINIVGIILLINSPTLIESFSNGRYVNSVENKVLNHVNYTKSPNSRFTNTIVVCQFSSDVVLNIPAGIGISCSDTLTDKLNSKYIYSKNKLDLLTYKIIDSNESGYLYQKTVAN